jgi:hypothetical protein
LASPAVDTEIGVNTLRESTRPGCAVDRLIRQCDLFVPNVEAEERARTACAAVCHPTCGSVTHGVVW